MNPIEANNRAAGRFQYRKDTSFGDPWKILDTNRSSIRGDCEDYALTVLSLIEGGGILGVLEALWAKRASIWFCIDPQGDNHHVLEYRKTGMVDNQTKRWSSRESYEKKGYRFKHRQPFIVCLFRLVLGLLG
jgi:predicted transglutaminase-like cysteine proteinase